MSAGAGALATGAGTAGASAAGEGARRRAAILEVVAAAVAFGASVPAAKALLRGFSPAALAGALYLAAGLSLAALLAASRLVTLLGARRFVTLLGTRRLVTRAARERGPGATERAAGISTRDLAILALAILAGGVGGPLALLSGLARVPAYVAALLLNLEGLFTIAIAAAFGRERLGRRGLAGAAAILAGGIVLARAGEAGAGAPGTAASSAIPLGGAALIVLACLAWATDNNLTRMVSVHDARVIAAAKGLAGGSFCLGLAGLKGELGGFEVREIAAAAAVGAISYGGSLVLFIRGLRHLGVALTGALFATAPGAGVLLAWLALAEDPGLAGFASLALMSAGAGALASDRHAHPHLHEPLVHAHTHEHDEHHQHEHTPGELAARPHSHLHRHERIEHAHPHDADIHHRHRHGRG